jgi:hypothetical protein
LVFLVPRKIWQPWSRERFYSTGFVTKLRQRFLRKSFYWIAARRKIEPIIFLNNLAAQSCGYVQLWLKIVDTDDCFFLTTTSTAKTLVLESLIWRRRWSGWPDEFVKKSPKM